MSGCSLIIALNFDSNPLNQIHCICGFSFENLPQEASSPLLHCFDLIYNHLEGSIQAHLGTKGNNDDYSKFFSLEIAFQTMSISIHVDAMIELRYNKNAFIRQHSPAFPAFILKKGRMLIKGVHVRPLERSHIIAYDK